MFRWALFRAGRLGDRSLAIGAVQGARCEVLRTEQCLILDEAKALAEAEAEDGGNEMVTRE
eukprot:scaffold29076_cov33-Phaeocystis_antarctica.AAC.1